jgi:hypothetical protein
MSFPHSRVKRIDFGAQIFHVQHFCIKAGSKSFENFIRFLSAADPFCGAI